MIGDYEYLTPEKARVLLADWLAWAEQREPETSSFSCQLRSVGQDLLVADVIIGDRIPRRRKAGV